MMTAPDHQATRRYRLGVLGETSKGIVSGLSLAFLLPIMVIFILGSRNKYKYTNKIGNKYYVEYYSTDFGLLTAQYFTDSTTFKIYVGTCDEETQWFHYHFIKNSVIIESREFDPVYADRRVIMVRSKTYDLYKLYGYPFFEWNIKRKLNKKPDNKRFGVRGVFYNGITVKAAPDHQATSRYRT